MTDEHPIPLRTAIYGDEDSIKEDGDFTIDISPIEEGRIFLYFPDGISWFAAPPETMIRLGKALLKTAGYKDANLDTLDRVRALCKEWDAEDDSKAAPRDARTGNRYWSISPDMASCIEQLHAALEDNRHES